MGFHKLSPKRQTRRATVKAWVVLTLPALLGVLAIVVDGGRTMEERRNDQVLADVAALAAAGDLYANYWTNHGTDPKGTARNAAIQAAASNGIASSAVTVNIPPVSGTYSGQSGYVEVIIQTDLSATFARALTRSDIPVKARSVARGQPMKIGMLLLRPTGADAFLNKALAFALINSPLIVNSSDAAAYDQASIGAVISSRIDLTGNYINPGIALILTKIRTGVPPTPDPLAYLPTPDTVLAPVQSSAQLVINSFVPKALSPGVYQGGIVVQGGSIVTMQPGVYIMQGGGFQVQGAATVIGQEVMIFNFSDSSHVAGPISITSLGKVALTAPVTGVYQGINFFQDRTQTTAITMQGFGLAAITGLIYGAKAPVNISGGAVIGLDILGGGYVVDSATVNGVGVININLGLNPPRIPDVRLVE